MFGSTHGQIQKMLGGLVVSQPLKHICINPIVVDLVGNDVVMTQQNRFVVEITKKCDIEQHFSFFCPHMWGVPEKNKIFGIFYCLLHFWILWDKRSTSRKKKEKARLEVRLFLLLSSFFASFFRSDNEMSWNVVCFETWRTFSKRHDKLHSNLGSRWHAAQWEWWGIAWSSWHQGCSRTYLPCWCSGVGQCLFKSCRSMEIHWFHGVTQNMPRCLWGTAQGQLGPTWDSSYRNGHCSFPFPVMSEGLSHRDSHWWWCWSWDGDYSRLGGTKWNKQRSEGVVPHAVHLFQGLFHHCALHLESIRFWQGCKDCHPWDVTTSWLCCSNNHRQLFASLLSWNPLFQEGSCTPIFWWGTSPCIGSNQWRDLWVAHGLLPLFPPYKGVIETAALTDWLGPELPVWAADPGLVDHLVLGLPGRLSPAMSAMSTSWPWSGALNWSSSTTECCVGLFFAIKMYDLHAQ